MKPEPIEPKAADWTRVYERIMLVLRVLGALATIGVFVTCVARLFTP